MVQPKRITVDGVTKTLREWAESTGISKITIQNRLQRGWDPKKAVTTPQLQDHSPKDAPFRVDYWFISAWNIVHDSDPVCPKCNGAMKENDMVQWTGKGKTRALVHLKHLKDDEE